MLSPPSSLLTITWQVYFACALHYSRTSWSTLFWLFDAKNVKSWKSARHGFSAVNFNNREILQRADNIIARMERAATATAMFLSTSCFKSLSCAEQLALRSHASNAVRGIAWPNSFYRDLLQEPAGAFTIPLVSYAQVDRFRTVGINIVENDKKRDTLLLTKTSLQVTLSSQPTPPPSALGGGRGMLGWLWWVMGGSVFMCTAISIFPPPPPAAWARK